MGNCCAQTNYEQTIPLVFIIQMFGNADGRFVNMLYRELTVQDGTLRRKLKRKEKEEELNN